MTWDPSPEELAEDEAFRRFYGDWQALDPAGTAAFMRRDLPLLRAHVGDRHHLGSAGGGALRPVDDDWPEPHEQAGQVWLRDHAAAPWFLDCILSDDRDGLWVSRRDDAHVVPLADVTWVAADGIRYMRPEVVLHHKARLDRPKDTVDLEVTWPLLDAGARAWLRDAVRREREDHPWLQSAMAE